MSSEHPEPDHTAMNTNLPFRRTRAKLRGFTLVELLVSIAIIAVLAALAFTVFLKVRESGYQTTSLNNLKQLQLANETYSNENNGVYVQAWSFDDEGNQNPAKWNVNQEFLRYYRGPVSDNAPTTVKNGVPLEMLDPIAVKARVGSNWSKLQKSYGLNINTLEGGGNNTPGSVRRIIASRLISPARTCAFMTAQNPFVHHSGRFVYDGTENSGGGVTTSYRYKGKAIAVFYDGHTELISKKDMERFDEEGGSSNIFWKGYE
ncbi:MAG: type II secretion system protein [Akkermansiaceae bacterium]